MWHHLLKTHQNRTVMLLAVFAVSILFCDDRDMTPIHKSSKQCCTAGVSLSNQSNNHLWQVNHL